MWVDQQVVVEVLVLVVVNKVGMLEEIHVVVLEEIEVVLLEEIDVVVLEVIEMVSLVEMSVVREVETREEQEVVVVLKDVVLLSEKQFPTDSLIFGSQQQCSS